MEDGAGESGKAGDGEVPPSRISGYRAPSDSRAVGPAAGPVAVSAGEAECRRNADTSLRAERPWSAYPGR
jgi:hypothetical protein